MRTIVVTVLWYFVVGMKDASAVSPDLTLGNLGLDSLMVAEIKQMLHQYYDISMSTEEIRALTFHRLQGIS